MELGEASRLLVRLMSASTLRARVIANNIANQNVPGYQREVVRFEELLAEAAHSPAFAKGVESSERTRLLESIQPRVEVDRLTPSTPDGNNVSPELEQNAMRENRLLYELYASILQSRNAMLDASVAQGR